MRIKKRKFLSDKEKLDLLEEYLKENSKVIDKDLVYKGYNLESIRDSLRKKHNNGELEYELEKRLTENRDLLRRIDKVLLEKYYFLESMFGKSKEELKSAKTENGIPFSIVKYQIQNAYNRRELELDLTPKQIRNLMENGILDYSKEEEEEIIKQSQFSKKDALTISKRYGSFSHFIREYKECKIIYYFKRNLFHC